MHKISRISNDHKQDNHKDESFQITSTNKIFKSYNILIGYTHEKFTLFNIQLNDLSTLLVDWAHTDFLISILKSGSGLNPLKFSINPVSCQKLSTTSILSCNLFILLFYLILVITVYLLLIGFSSL